MAHLGVRFQILSLEGEVLGQITNPLDFAWRVDADKVSTLTMTLTGAVAGHRAVRPPCVIALQQRVEMPRIGLVWDEVPNGRFYVTNITHDSRDITQAFKVEAKGAAWALQGALVGWPYGNKMPESRVFKGDTPGGIIRTLFVDAKRRGALAGLECSVSAGSDSASNNWDGTVTREYDTSATLWDVLSDLRDGGDIVFETVRDQLKVYRGSYTRDRSATTVLSSTQTERNSHTADWSDWTNAYRVDGDDNRTTTRIYPNGAYGRRETALSRAGTQDDAAALGLAASDYAKRTRANAAATISWVYQGPDTTPYVPGLNLNVDDIVTVVYDELWSAQKKKLTVPVSETSLSLRGSGDQAYYEISAVVGYRNHSAVRRLADQARALSKTKPTALGKPRATIDPLTQIPDSSIPNSKLQTPGGGGGGGAAIGWDETPTLGSRNAVRSNGIKTELDKKQDSLAFDSTPTAASTNPATSGGIKTALDKKQDKLTFDAAPTAGSSNPVTSGGIKTALDAKQNKLTFDAAPTAGSSNPVTSGGIKNYIDSNLPPPTRTVWMNKVVDLPTVWVNDIEVSLQLTGFEANGLPRVRLTIKKANPSDIKKNPQLGVVMPGNFKIPDRKGDTVWSFGYTTLMSSFAGNLTAKTRTAPTASINGDGTTITTTKSDMPRNAELSRVNPVNRLDLTGIANKLRDPTDYFTFTADFTGTN